MGVGVLTDESAPAVLALEGCVPAQKCLEGVKHRHDEAPALGQDTTELSDSGIEVGDVRQREAADDDVERPVVGGKAQDVTLEEASRGDRRSGPGEHLRGEVDAHHVVSELREVTSM